MTIALGNDEFAKLISDIKKTELINSIRIKTPNNNMSPISELTLAPDEIESIDCEIQELTNAIALYKSKNRNIDQYSSEKTEAKYSNFLDGVNCLTKDMELVSLYRQLKNEDIKNLSVTKLEEITRPINFFKPGIRRKAFTKELGLTHGKELIYTPPNSRTVIRIQLEEIINFINSKNKLSPIDIGLIYYQLLAIQPLYSKNSQVSRAIMNAIFSKNYGLETCIPISKQLHNESSKHNRCVRLALKEQAYLPLIRLTISSYTKAIESLC